MILSSVTSSKRMLEASRKVSVAATGCRNEDCAYSHLKSLHLAASYAVRKKVDRRFKVTLGIPSRSPSFPLKRKKGQGAIDLYVCNVNSSVCVCPSVSVCFCLCHSVCLCLSVCLSLSLSLSLIYVCPGDIHEMQHQGKRDGERGVGVYRLRWQTASRYALGIFARPSHGPIYMSMP